MTSNNSHSDSLRIVVLARAVWLNAKSVWKAVAAFQRHVFHNAVIASCNSTLLILRCMKSQRRPC